MCIRDRYYPLLVKDENIMIKAGWSPKIIKEIKGFQNNKYDFEGVVFNFQKKNLFTPENHEKEFYYFINSKVLSNESETIIFSSTKNLELNIDNEVIKQFDLDSILESLFKRGIQSMILEGGAYTIQKFIDSYKWDCIRIFKSEKNLFEGVVAPKYEIDKLEYRLIGDNRFYEIFKN